MRAHAHRARVDVSAVNEWRRRARICLTRPRLPSAPPSRARAPVALQRSIRLQTFPEVVSTLPFRANFNNDPPPACEGQVPTHAGQKYAVYLELENSADPPAFPNVRARSCACARARAQIPLTDARARRMLTTRPHAHGHVPWRERIVDCDSRAARVHNGQFLGLAIPRLLRRYRLVAPSVQLFAGGHRGCRARLLRLRERCASAGARPRRERVPAARRGGGCDRIVRRRAASGLNEGGGQARRSAHRTLALRTLAHPTLERGRSC